MSAKTYDAIVLGGGPAGYVCAIRMGQLGLKVACVEGEDVGGVCLNWGCIPSKALISTAHLYEKAKSSAEMGLVVEGIHLDTNKLQDWKSGIVKKLTSGVRTLLKTAGAEIWEGRGRLVTKDTVEVQKKDGTTERITAKRGIVVATGSSTIEIPGFPFDGERIIGAKDAVSLRKIPKRLLVVGGGVIGLELGMVYQKFGSAVTVVELTDGLLPGTDRECVKVVERRFKKLGGTVITEARAESFERRGDALFVRVVTKTSADVHECDVVLVAVGMRPRSRGIGLEELGVEIDSRGFVKTDSQAKTNVAGVYAIGDVSGAPMLAHKAMKEGEVCAEVIAGHAAGKDWVTVPGVIFTDPEVASVGLSEEAAAKERLEVKTGRFPFAALGRAMALGETDGFVKVLTDKSSGRVVGIHVVGPGASDLISEAALALEMVATADDIALTIHPHPTLGEAMMEASAASLGKAVHIVNR